MTELMSCQDPLMPVPAVIPATAMVADAEMPTTASAIAMCFFMFASPFAGRATQYGFDIFRAIFRSLSLWHIGWQGWINLYRSGETTAIGPKTNLIATNG
jgi:hypothetical protein